MTIERILGTDTGKDAFYKADRNFQALDGDKIDKTQFKEATGYGVISGLSVSPQTVADRTVKVSAGIVHMPDGKRFAPAAVASQAVNTANATNPRIDVVYVSESGVISYLAGVAASTPTSPEIPTGGVLLAQIAVAANATTITSANVIDKRLIKNNSNVLQDQIGSLLSLSTTEKSNLVGAINDNRTQINNCVPKADIVQTTEVNDSTKVPSSSVTFALKQEINTANNNILQKLSASEKFFTINNSGWYRIAKFQTNNIATAEGASCNSVDIDIRREYASGDNEYYKLLLMSIYQKSQFVKIGKLINTQLITKIRHAIDTTNKIAYLEIYYSQANANNIKITLYNNSDTVNSTKWEVMSPILTQETLANVVIRSIMDLTTA